MNPTAISDLFGQVPGKKSKKVCPKTARLIEGCLFLGECGELSMEELRAAVDGDAFDKVLALLEDQLPIPVLFKGTLSREAVREQLVTAMGLLDSDGDGKVS